MIRTKHNVPDAPNVMRLPLNTSGRDFVIGDIHGAYDSVLLAMKEVSFDPARDRLFALGDLIDRGKGSHRVVRFLAQPYVHSIRGNHEDMLLQLYQQGPPPDELLAWAANQNGFGWWLDTTLGDRAAIVDAVRKLPLVIEIPTHRGTVGLVHADIPSGVDWSRFLQLLDAGDERTIETALWGRTRLRSGNEDGVRGIGRVFVGHTPQWNGICRFGNVYAMDTGGVFAELDTLDRYPGARMSMANISMKTVNLTHVIEPTSIDARDEEPPVAPFGDYAL